MEENFYADLQSFSNFEEVTEDRHFTTVPGDWSVVVSDVADSTTLIENHRYKDVNTIGAATIVAVKNALGTVDIPYVFGGDGATLLIPNSDRELVARNLSSLRDIAKQRFEMKLRVAIIPIQEITNEETVIEVAKFELIAGQSVALFRGGGLTQAERMAKDSSALYEIPTLEADSVDLKGLSCRWHEIPNKNGFILSLLVKARRDNSTAVYIDLIAKLTEIFGGVLGDANPVNPSLMTYRSIEQSSKDEKRLENSSFLAWMKRRLEIVAAVLIFKWKLIPRFLIQRNAYVQAMRTHSDYRKFDDMFRMILDCTPQQVMELAEYLDGAHERGELCYGIHQSRTSLMTCFVQGLGNGSHIHFIDGGDGGYAKASRHLGEQIRNSDFQ